MGGGGSMQGESISMDTLHSKYLLIIHGESRLGSRIENLEFRAVAWIRNLSIQKSLAYRSYLWS